MKEESAAALPSRPRRKLRFLVALVLSVLVTANVLAFMHAWAMTHYEEGAPRPKKPEELGLVDKLGVLVTGITLPRPVLKKTPADVGLVFSTCSFPSDGETLEGWFVPRQDRAFASERSRGLAVLFHGYGGSKGTLVGWARAYNDLGFDTFLVDFRGSGGSTGSKTTIGVREALDVVESVKVARTLSPHEPVLAGVSMGAVAILRAIHETPALSPRAVVLECPFDTLLHTVEHRFEKMGVPSFPGARLLVFWGGVQQGFSGFEHRPVDFAASVSCPALLLQGDRDPYITLDESKSIHEKLASSRKVFHVFQGAGHESFLARSPDEWKAVVSDFLK